MSIVTKFFKEMSHYTFICGRQCEENRSAAGSDLLPNRCSPSGFTKFAFLPRKLPTSVSHNLKFMCPCIANIFFKCNQQNATLHSLFISVNALQVSRGSSAYHQELKTVYTASGTLSNLYCYLPRQWQVAVKV